MPFINKITTTPLMDWQAATADLRKAAYDAAYDRALAKIEETRTSKKTTATQRNQARSAATRFVMQKLAKIEEFEGVRNPTYDDPEWGYGVVAAKLAETKAANQAAADEEAKAKPELDDLAAWLEAQDWSEFAQSLARQYRSTGRLSSFPGGYFILKISKDGSVKTIRASE